ncbi:hypothetical protein EJB05_20671, partial [Eragrostis curvula]
MAYDVALGVMENSLESSGKSCGTRLCLRHRRNAERRALKGSGVIGVGRDGMAERKAARAFSGREADAEVGGEELLGVLGAARAGEAARSEGERVAGGAGGEGGRVDGLDDGDCAVRVVLPAEALLGDLTRQRGVASGGGERAAEEGVSAAAAAEEEGGGGHFRGRRRQWGGKGFWVSLRLLGFVLAEWPLLGLFGPCIAKSELFSPKQISLTLSGTAIAFIASAASRSRAVTGDLTARPRLLHPPRLVE